MNTKNMIIFIFFVDIVQNKNDSGKISKILNN
jgi:hypothetical protein